MSSSRKRGYTPLLSFINRTTIRPVAHRTHTFLSFFQSFFLSLCVFFQSGDPQWFSTPTTFSFQKFDTFYWAHIVNLVGSSPPACHRLWLCDKWGRPWKTAASHCLPGPGWDLSLSLSPSDWSGLMLVICFQFQSHLHGNVCWKDIRNWYFQKYVETVICWPL